MDGNGDLHQRRSGKPRRRRDDRLLRWWIGGVTVIAVAVFVQGCHIGSNTSQISRNTDRIAEVQREACERVNTLRGNDNKNAVTQFLTIRFAEQLVAGSPGGIAGKFHHLANGINYVPRTDCERASSGHFAAPAPRPLAPLTDGELENIRTKGYP